MLIQINMVPEDQPYRLSFIVTPSQMALEGQSLFTTSIKCDLNLRKIHADIFVQASICGLATPCCDRCTNAFDFDISQETSFHCLPMQGDQMVDEDDDIYYFQGAQLDMAPIMREIILLDLPMQYICTPACQGLCVDCGTKLDDQRACSSCQKSADFPQKILQV